MPDTITKAITRPGAYPAFLAAFGVFATLLVIGVAHGLLSTVGSVIGGPDQSQIGQIWLFQLISSVSGPVPFALGIFLSFWQIAPIAAVLRLAHVVTRSILAAVLGGVTLWLFGLITAFVITISDNPFSFRIGDVGTRLGADALEPVFPALNYLISELPVAVLAGILLWGWLQRHPPKTPVHGALDEV